MRLAEKYHYVYTFLMPLINLSDHKKKKCQFVEVCVCSSHNY